MKKGEVAKLTNDITFYDKTTWLPNCTFNGCVEKFSVVEVKQTDIPLLWKKAPIVYNKFIVKCSECGNSIETFSTREKTKKSYEAAKRAIKGF